MLLLPYHQNIHEYAEKNNKSIWSRLRQRPVALSLLLLSIFVLTFHTYKSQYKVTFVKQSSISNTAAATNPTSHRWNAAWWPSLSSTTNSEEDDLWHIEESEWHMPKDIHLTQQDPLWESGKSAYFRQQPDNLHRAEGYGTPVDLWGAPFVRRSLYRHLLQTFHAFSELHDFHFWLAHGTLLGQQWGQKIMSGDTDVDIQCTMGALHRVTRHERKLWEGRFFLIVNPHFLLRKTNNREEVNQETGRWIDTLGDEANVIDARWIDTLTGFYIDITALSSLQADEPWSDVAPFRATRVKDKSPHSYTTASLTPNRRCTFEDREMWCPNQSREILRQEYGDDYNNPHFRTWRYNETMEAFNEVTCESLITMYTAPTLANCDTECQSIVKHERRLEWNVIRDDREKGCLLRVSWSPERGAKETTREYWGREIGGQVLPGSNTSTFAAVVL